MFFLNNIICLLIGKLLFIIMNLLIGRKFVYKEKDEYYYQLTGLLTILLIAILTANLRC